MASPLFRSRRHQVSRKLSRRGRSWRVAFEQLEDRQLLASDWHNALLPTDVNVDRRVSPLDALQVINMLNSDLSLQLPDLGAGESPDAYYGPSHKKCRIGIARNCD